MDPIYQLPDEFATVDEVRCGALAFDVRLDPSRGKPCVEAPEAIGAAHGWFRRPDLELLRDEYHAATDAETDEQREAARLMAEEDARRDAALDDAARLADEAARKTADPQLPSTPETPAPSVEPVRADGDPDVAAADQPATSDGAIVLDPVVPTTSENGETESANVLQRALRRGKKSQEK